MNPAQRSEKVRLGVIGCGSSAFDAHADAIEKASNVQLQAIFDEDRSRLVDMRERLRPARTYRQEDEMLADPQVDLVLIADEDAFNTHLAQKVLAAGKDVLMGNAFAVPIEAHESLRRLSVGRIFALGCHRRFLPGVRATRNFLAEEGGKVTSYAGYYFDSRYHAGTTPLNARRLQGDWKTKDKRLHSWSIHAPQLLDMARHLLGPIAAIRAMHGEVHPTATLPSDGARGHVWSVDLRFASGSFGQLSLLLHRGSTFEEGFELRCDGGKVTCGFPYSRFHREHTRIFSCSRKLYWSPDARDCHTFRLQLESIAATILGSEPTHHADLEEGIACTRALMAGSYSLLHAGQWVDVDHRDQELAVA